MKHIKLLYPPVSHIQKHETSDSHISGCVVIDADWIARHLSEMEQIARSCNKEIRESIATEMSHFISNCHCDDIAYWRIWDEPSTDWFQRIGSYADESSQWRSNLPVAFKKFLKSTNTEDK